MSRNRWEDLDFRYEEPNYDYIIKEMSKIEELIKEFCIVSDVGFERIDVSSKTLKDIIIRIDMRCLYFRIYHKNMYANEYKINTGLLIFWILKLRPFWIKIQDYDSDNEIETATYINEKICVYIVLSLLEEYNSEFFNNDKGVLNAYVNELEYSFRYRDLSKESLFLIFDPYYYLYRYGQINSND